MKKRKFIDGSTYSFYILHYLFCNLYHDVLKIKKENKFQLINKNKFLLIINL